MDRNQEPNHPFDAPTSPGAPSTAQSPPTTQTPLTQFSAMSPGSAPHPAPVPTPFTQATSTPGAIPSHSEQSYPISTPTMQPQPVLSSPFTTEPTSRITSAPIPVSGAPPSPTTGPGFTPAHPERQSTGPNALIVDPTTGGSQPGSLHRGQDQEPLRQTTLSIDKLPLDDMETLPGSVHGIAPPRRRVSQYTGPLPPLPHEIRVGRPVADHRTSTRVRSTIDHVVPVDEKIYSQKTVEERLRPTLEQATALKVKHAAKARLTGYLLNLAIGLQVLLGALTTGLSAATTSSLAVSILGGLSTVVASYLARTRGTGEPENSRLLVKDLDQFIRECEILQMDHGHVVGNQFDVQIDSLRRRFEELLGNINSERRSNPPPPPA